MKGGRGNPLPMPTVIGTIAMKDVPAPPVHTGRDKYDPLWQKVLNAPAGQAVMLKFTVHRQALAVRGVFRKKAKAVGRFLSSSHTHDGLTWYFWLEPKGVK